MPTRYASTPRPSSCATDAEVSARLRGALRRALHGEVAVWYHPTFRLPFAGLEATIGMDPSRADHVLTWLLDQRILREEAVHQPDEAPWGWLREVHDEDYLASLDLPATIAAITGLDERRIDTATVLESWRRAVAGTVAASRHVLANGGRAAVLLGGFHHAAPSRGAGFCALNDVAVAVRRVRSDGFSGRIVVVDVDAHPPDGLAEALADDAGVIVASLGVASAWSVPESVRDHRVPRGTGDEAYLAVLDELLADLPPAELAFVLAGADPLDGDRFGELACSEAGLRTRDHRVLARLGHTPTVLLPAGGYTHRAWRVFANTLAEAAGSKRGPREGYDPVLRRTRTIARTLDPQSLGQGDSLLTAEDVAEALGLPGPTQPRVLGYYTRQGVEYALVRYGLIEALKRMGFHDLRVETDAQDQPHRIRVLADVNGRTESLIEVMLSVRTVERWRTLFVEWLALRDPRVAFTPDRPRLPGQDAPGLGLADEAGHLLLRMAERLGLAGVSFVPAHYHVAWMGRERFVFVDPRARGRFDALRAHLRRVPLLEASKLLDGAGVATEYGEPVRWEPTTMVLPLHPDLKRWLDEQDVEATSAAEGLRETLISVA